MLLTRIWAKKSQEGLSSEAYDQFKTLRKSNKLKGMGPAYFTKLICFINLSVGGYIMDQWTSKSVNLLLGKKLVNLNSSGMVSDNNNSKIYEEFCLVIEDLALNIQKNPIDTEEMLFNYGGRRKGIWRQYVIENWGAKQITHSKRKFKTKTVNKIDMTDMERIDYNDAVNYYDNTWLDIKTLGKRKSLFVKSSEGSIFLRNSQNNELRIDQPHWNAVMERIEELPQEERLMSSRYSLGKEPFNWNNAPNKNFSPYVPAIVRYMIENPG